jgi:hypothetical protein
MCKARATRAASNLTCGERWILSLPRLLLRYLLHSIIAQYLDKQFVEFCWKSDDLSHRRLARCSKKRMVGSKWSKYLAHQTSPPFFERWTYSRFTRISFSLFTLDVHTYSTNAACYSMQEVISRVTSIDNILKSSNRSAEDDYFWKTTKKSCAID